MLDKASDCLNSLRVTTTSWPGFVIYQGLTTKTALCSSNKIDGGGHEVKEEKISNYGHRHRQIKLTNPPIVKERTLDMKMVDNNEQDCDLATSHRNLEGVDKKPINNDKQTRTNSYDSSSDPQLGPDDSSMSSASSASSDKSTLPNVQQHERPLLAMSSVSCNELASGEDGQLDVFTIDGGLRMPPWTPIAASCQQRPRPHTAGPRVLFPPKHSCPEGLTAQDFIQGQGLSKKERPSTGRLRSPDRSRKGLPDVSFGRSEESRDTAGCNKCHSSTPYSNTQHSVYLVNNSNCACSFRRGDRHQVSQRRPGDQFRFSPHKEDAVPLELTITPLSLSGISNRKNNHEPQEEFDTEIPEVESEQKIRPGSNLTDPSLVVDTIEGIKKSYQRAHSAPPTHSHGHNGGGFAADSTGGGEVKQFSNLYYRAKSAYHKRQDTDSADALESQATSTTRGSLLRPLLCTDKKGPTKRGDGCHSKCKNCFKACLVSQDYVQKAIARAMLERESQRQQLQHQPQQQPQQLQRSRSASVRNATRPKSTPTWKHYKSADLVNQALARNQPLFHRVYGPQGSAGRQRITARPWPRYGWVDLTGRRDEPIDKLSSEPEQCSNKEDA